MPFSAIQQQVERELGKPLNAAFKSFDEQPFAAASIGQVHKAVLPNGQQVVVKVQYPGVDEACESDLKQVRLALRLMGVLKIDKKLQEQKRPTRMLKILHYREAVHLCDHDRGYKEVHQ